MREPLEYPYNLLKAVGLMRSSEWMENIYDADGEVFSDAVFALPPDFDGSLEYVLHTLNEREQKIVSLRFKENYTLQVCGDILNLSKERIRQIEEQTLRKLRHPNRINYLKYGVAAELERKANERAEQIAEEKIKEARSEGFVSGRESALEQPIRKVVGSYGNPSEPRTERDTGNIMHNPIEWLCLSNRASNCLKRRSIKYVYQLAELSAEQLLKFRCLGVGTLNEIREKLHQCGIDIKDYTDRGESE